MVVAILGLLVTIAGLPLAYLAYRSQRRRRRLEYVILSSTKLLSGPRLPGLELHLQERVVTNGVVTLARVANVGDEALDPDDFHSPLIFDLGTRTEALAAQVTRTRPAGLTVTAEVSGNEVNILPLLLNVEEMVEVQIVSSQLSGPVTLRGRIKGFQIAIRKSLPYPPGSGYEGEMTPFDKFMWFVLGPVIYVVAAFSISFFILAHVNPKHLQVDAIAAIACTLLVLAAYLLNTRTLIKRRRIWRP